MVEHREKQITFATSKRLISLYSNYYENKIRLKYLPAKFCFFNFCSSILQKLATLSFSVSFFLSKSLTWNKKNPVDVRYGMTCFLNFVDFRLRHLHHYSKKKKIIMKFMCLHRQVTMNCKKWKTRKQTLKTSA